MLQEVEGEIPRLQVGEDQHVGVLLELGEGEVLRRSALSRAVASCISPSTDQIRGALAWRSRWRGAPSRAKGGRRCRSWRRRAWPPGARCPASARCARPAARSRPALRRSGSMFTAQSARMITSLGQQHQVVARDTPDARGRADDLEDGPQRLDVVRRGAGDHHVGVAGVEHHRGEVVGLEQPLRRRGCRITPRRRRRRKYSST